MNQKNRLLREAFVMLTGIAAGIIKPLGYQEQMEEVVRLRDRIAKNLEQ